MQNLFFKTETFALDLLLAALLTEKKVFKGVVISVL